jgi:hypothetical protein
LPVSPVPAAVHVPPKYPTATIFVDESATKVSAGRFFVVGAVKARKAGLLLRAVHDLRDRYSYSEEFKFSKITRARLPIFSELVDLLEQSDAHIAASIVDGTKCGDPFAGPDPQWVVHARVCLDRQAVVAQGQDRRAAGGGVWGAESPRRAHGTS